MINDDEYINLVQKRLDTYFVSEIKAGELISLYPKCAYCGTSLDETNSEIEHIDTPISPKDYVNKAYPENIVLCCGSCNRSKGKIPLEDWFRKIKNPEYLGTEYMNLEKRQTIIEWTISSKHPKDTIKQTAERIFKDN